MACHSQTHSAGSKKEGPTANVAQTPGDLGGLMDPKKPVLQAGGAASRRTMTAESACLVLRSAARRRGDTFEILRLFQLIHAAAVYPTKKHNTDAL